MIFASDTAKGNPPMERVRDLTAEQRAANAETDFLKLVYLLAKHAGRPGAIEEARDRFKSPRLEMFVKSAVVAGSQQGTWGGDLADYSYVGREWVTKVSRKTVRGQLNAIRAGFNVRTIVETTGASATFVPSGGPIFVQALSITDTALLDLLKLATICVFTRESVQTWGPAVQANIEDRLGLALIRGDDSAFLDPDKAAVAGERPASILNGVSPLGDLTNTAAGALADIETMLAAHVDAGSDLDRVLIACHPRTCLALSLLQTSGGNAAFPALGATGGSILGVPVVTSVGCVRSGSPTERIIAALDGGKIVVADDGAIDLAASAVTSLQMDDAASQSAHTGTATSVTSMYQTESVALRARRYANWQRADASAVSWMTSAV